MKCLNSDDWDELSIARLEAGGNSGFDQLVKKFLLPENPPLAKYQTKAARHYRLQLESVAKKTVFEDPAPSLEEGKESIPIVPDVGYFVLE